MAPYDRVIPAKHRKGRAPFFWVRLSDTLETLGLALRLDQIYDVSGPERYESTAENSVQQIDRPAPGSAKTILLHPVSLVSS
jgi:hypothetical protein